nr:hypothetical protein [Salmonella enterica]
MYTGVGMAGGFFFLKKKTPPPYQRRYTYLHGKKYPLRQTRWPDCPSNQDFLR